VLLVQFFFQFFCLVQGRTGQFASDQSDGGAVTLQRDHLQQHEEKGQAQPRTEILPGR
jgi:hypothetical protein